jgi:cohesin complex subunit SCC1
MQKSGGFVSSIMMEGRSLSWAPELRGMLSLDMVRGANDLKRKRDSGVADVDSELGGLKSPRLELGDDTDFTLDGNAFGNNSVAADGTILEIPADESAAHFDDDHADREGSPMPAFEDTTLPLIHPADSGAVSAGTKHAVHILRELFGPDAAEDADKRKKSTVVFQKLLPEKETTKAEATKMFFEYLLPRMLSRSSRAQVLATLSKSEESADSGVLGLSEKLEAKSPTKTSQSPLPL